MAQRRRIALCPVTLRANSGISKLSNYITCVAKFFKGAYLLYDEGLTVIHPTYSKGGFLGGICNHRNRVVYGPSEPLTQARATADAFQQQVTKISILVE